MVALHILVMAALPFALATTAAWMVRFLFQRRALGIARACAPRSGETVQTGRLVVRRVAPSKSTSEPAASSVWVTGRKRRLDVAKIASTERSGDLALATANGDIELVGPIEVVVGTHAACSKHLHEEGVDDAIVMRVADGDRVRVFGKLVEVADSQRSAVGYRAKAARNTMAPLEGGVLRIVAQHAPAISDRSSAWHPIAVAVALGSVGLPFGAVHDFTTSGSAVSERCKKEGRCTVVPTWRWREGGWREIFGGWLAARHFHPVASSDDDCRKSAPCEARGACTALSGACRAVRDEDCRRSTECLSRGLCSVTNGGCGIAHDEDCFATDGCRIDGRCAAVGGDCVASELACRTSDACANQGRCSAVRGYCVAASDADCRQASVCRDNGQCAASEGWCVSSGPDCLKSWKCLEYGGCSAYQRECYARSDDDCARSTECRDRGACDFDGVGCVASDLDCRKNDACRIYGACSVENGVCKATSERDCRASLGCKERGACRLLDGRCLRACSEEADCQLVGLCTEHAGRCVARADDCAKSIVCAGNGRCTAQGDRCIAGSDDDCRGSRDCRQQGACSARDGQCAATTNADCRRSDMCLDYAQCSYVAGGCRRVTDDDCKHTRRCATFGECSLGSKGCEVKRDEDCQSSEVCKVKGWCAAVETRDRSGSGSADKVCFVARELTAH